MSDAFEYTPSVECDGIKYFPATDTNLFKYCGVWQATDSEHPNTMVSYWDAAYVEVDFAGGSITPVFSSPTTFLYRIDNENYIAQEKIEGEFTVYASDVGRHTLRILSNENDRSIYLAGVKTDNDTVLFRTPKRKHYIQFIGDSISDMTSSFSHNSADMIDWDYSVIACEALSMVRNAGYWKYNNGFDHQGRYDENSMAYHFKNNFGITSVGMEDAFFKLGIPNHWKPEHPKFTDVAQCYFTEKYDFDFNTRNNPDVVFIFLGTNDIPRDCSEKTVQTFKDTYISFVQKLFKIYGEDTQIVIMQSISSSDASNPYSAHHPRFAAIRGVAQTLLETYPQSISFLDEDTLFSWKIELNGAHNDYTHPSAYGYATLSRRVAEWLDMKFK